MDIGVSLMLAKGLCRLCSGLYHSFRVGIMISNASRVFATSSSV